MNEEELKILRSITESIEQRLAEISDALHKIADTLQPRQGEVSELEDYEK